MQVIKNIFSAIIKLGFIKIILIFFLTFIFTILFIYYLNPYLCSLFPIDNIEVFNNKNETIKIFETFLLGCVAAPIGETLIFLFSPIKLWYKKYNILLLGIISSFLFAITHPYSLNYVFITFFLGLYLFIVFYILFRYSNIYLATICITILHFCNNFKLFLEMF
jgi:membrane protease YdiL (CAAX protease family)